MKKYIIGVMMILKVFITSDTNEINVTEATKWREIWADHYNIELALIRALWDQESLKGTSLMRYEKHLKNARWYTNRFTKEEKKDPYSYYSMGDLQILYGTAKAMGYKGTPHGLLNPCTNYQYGIKFLKKLCLSQKHLAEAVSSYNQGPVLDSKGKIRLTKFIDENKNGIKDKWEKWKNQRYVNAVLRKYKKYGGRQPVMHLIK